MADISRWEYTKLLVTTPEADPAGTVDQWMSQLNSLGANGWEAFGSVVFAPGQYPGAGNTRHASTSS
jgi:hypothetical protein